MPNIKKMIILPEVEFPEDFQPPEQFSGIFEDRKCKGCPFYDIEQMPICTTSDFCGLTKLEECDCPIHENWNLNEIVVNQKISNVIDE